MIDGSGNALYYQLSITPYLTTGGHYGIPREGDTMTQHCLSIRQPWASLVAYGEHTEFRTWDTSYRGQLIICATAKKVIIEGDEMPHGVAIATVEMAGTRKVKDGYEWIFENTRQIVPVPVKGRQRIFTIPDIKLEYLDDDDDHVEVFQKMFSSAE
jgi:hypothetical protein